MPIYKTERTKNGKTGYRVIINYVDNFGRKKSSEKIVYGSAEAKTALYRMEQDIKKIKPVKKMKFQELFNEYITDKKTNVRETTICHIKQTANNYFLPTFANTNVENLTNKSVLQQWKTQIAQTEHLTIKTKRTIFNNFNAVLNFAEKMDYIPKNNLKILGNFKDVNDFDKPQDKIHYYTAEQFKKYIEIAKRQAEQKNTVTDWGYYVFFNIAFFCGMRKGEINALKWSDIDGNTINIRRSVSQKLKGEDRETPPKNKSSYRSLQMPKQLMEIFAEHKKRQMADNEFTDDFRVCGGIKTLRNTNLAKRNQLFSKLSELPKIKIHDFRHSHATLLANEGINIQEIARRLGHTDIKMTLNTYAHLYPREEERALKILENL